MNDLLKPELTLAQIRQIMRSEDVPTGRLFANTRTMNNQAEEKQALATVNPAQLMQISTDVAAVCGKALLVRVDFRSAFGSGSIRLVPLV